MALNLFMRQKCDKPVNKRKNPHSCGLKYMARLEGLEPPTPCLEGRCSIRLSYKRIWSG